MHGAGVYVLAETHCARCGAALSCSVCGADLSHHHRGDYCPPNGPRTCSGPHRQAAYRRRKKAEAKGKPAPRCRAEFAALLPDEDVNGQRLIAPVELDLTCCRPDSHQGSHRDPIVGSWTVKRGACVLLRRTRGVNYARRVRARFLEEEAS